MIISSNAVLSDIERHRISKYFPILASTCTPIIEFERRLPLRVRKWRKLQIVNGGDTMVGINDAEASISVVKGRDRSFIWVRCFSTYSLGIIDLYQQYTLFPDQNALQSAEPDDPLQQIQYGRLLHIINFTFPVYPQAGMTFNTDRIYRLACIIPCKVLSHGDATEEIVKFEEMERTPVYVHIGVVECLVGRVKTQTGWAIIDQSDVYARTVFNDE